MGADDVVTIKVFGYDDLNSEARISRGGTIAFPLIGEVEIAGLSANAAADRIASKLMAGGFIREPKVSLMVSKFESQQISVMGQVSRPGKYSLSAASTLIDALAFAGGVVTATAGDQAILIKKSGDKQAVDLDALFAGDETQNLKIASGDMVFVPKAVQFYIYGEVQRPGMYRLERNMRVDQAITAGGGLTPRGSLNRVVLRRNSTRDETQEIDADETTILQPNDVVYVKESWF